MKVYVGTYAKYNNGKLLGKWFDIEDYDDKEEFLEACQNFHEDEDDPEFMFQDWEDIPGELISESCIDEEVFVLEKMYQQYGKDAVQAFIALFDRWNKGNFEDRYLGYHDSVQDFAEEWLDDTGALNEIPEKFRPYIDFERYGRDMILGGDILEHEGYYFWRN
jgi:antirestriction protein